MAILDFDGTLVESVGVKDRAFAELYGDLAEWPEIEAYHLSHNHVIRFDKFREIDERICGVEHTPARAAELAERFSALVAAGIAAAPEVPGATALLDALAAAGVRTYLLSASPADELAGILDARGLQGRFADVYAHPWRKREAIVDILRREGAAPEDAVLVGDTPEDAECAKDRGVAFVGRCSSRPMPDGLRVHADLRGVAAELGLEGPADLETCPACGLPWREDGPRAAYPAAGVAERGIEPPAEVAYCAGCGMGVAVPRWSDERLAALYADGEYWAAEGSGSADPRDHPVHTALARARWRMAEPHLPAGSLSVLDVGAGRGHFGDAAARAGRLARYCAVEADPRIAGGLRERWESDHPGVPLECVSSTSDAPDGFDLAVLSNVLEHVNEPLPLLAEAARRVRPGGVVLVDSPFRDERFKADVFPHVVFFAPGPMRALLGRAGLRVLALAPAGLAPGRSPLSSDWRGPLRAKGVGAVQRLRRVLPQGVTAGVLGAHFGAGRSGADGTWVRAVAVKEEAA